MDDWLEASDERMLKSVFHVVFSPSDAGALRQALAEQGRTDQVGCPGDDFSFGPIGADYAVRLAWIEQELGIFGWDRISKGTDAVLIASSAYDVLPVVWLSRRDVMSYSGFLWWLYNMGEAPCLIIDITNLKLGDRPNDVFGRRSTISIARLSTKDLKALLDTRMPLDPIARTVHHSRWQQLVTENAPFRIIDGLGSLSSAPITWFDQLIIARATTDWQKVTRIIGKVFRTFFAEDLLQTSDLILFARARALANCGALRWRGDLSSMSACEMRLAARAIDINQTDE